MKELITKKQKKLILVIPYCKKRESDRFKRMLECAIQGVFGNVETIRDMEDFFVKASKGYFRDKKIIFAVHLGESGVNLEYYRLLQQIRLDLNMFEGAVGGIIIDGEGELFTKNLGRELAFAANMSGMTFPGKPLVEATADLYNYNIQAKNLGTSNMQAYMESARKLFIKVLEFEKLDKAKKILALHSGQRGKSNSITLWDMAKEHISGEIQEISLRNGEVFDCQGCGYEVCKNFGERDKCFYGGVITKSVYPTILEVDAVVLICPNYNDALGANLTAFVNRLTALFITKDFSKKKVYGIVVSGYSGGDIVGGQIISGLNMNKAFVLPPRAILTETANNPGSIRERHGIMEKAAIFGSTI